MTQEEKDRLVEILFYLYFDNTDQRLLSSGLFWNVIKDICILNGINERAVTQAVRILMAEENKPQEKETYYLLNEIGLSVRPIRNISGIYWQKQKAYAEEFETNKPIIKRRLIDVIYKESVYAFIHAIYKVSGIFIGIDMDSIFGKGEK